MTEGKSSRRLPERRLPVFDVTGWLVDLSACNAHGLEYVTESERRGLLTVTYACGPEPITVSVRRVGGVAAAAWELTADIGQRVERVVLPGGTRFAWRPPRGTHV